MRSHKTHQSLTFALWFALPLIALLASRAQVGGVAAVSDAPNVPDKGLSLGHVPGLDDLTLRVREVQRLGLVSRDPRGMPVSASDWMNQSIEWLKSEEFNKATDDIHRASAICEQKGEPRDAHVMST